MGEFIVEDIPSGFEDTWNWIADDVEINEFSFEP